MYSSASVAPVLAPPPGPLFFDLLVGHALADYPLQGDFLARAKNWHTAIPGIDWWIALLAHSLIHGGTVALITGSIGLGLVEILVHFAIDWQKCAGRTTFRQDQLLHILCKAFYCLLISGVY